MAVLSDEFELVELVSVLTLFEVRTYSPSNPLDRALDSIP